MVTSKKGCKQKRMQAKVGGGLEKREKERERENILAFLLLVLVPPGIFSCLSLKLTLIIPTLWPFLLLSHSHYYFFPKGEEQISCYTFNTHEAKHYFCSTCGIHPFYQPRTNPEARGISLQCLDEEETRKNAEVVPCDAMNWEKWEQYLNEHPKARNLTENVE